MGSEADQGQLVGVHVPQPDAHELPDEHCFLHWLVVEHFKSLPHVPSASHFKQMGVPPAVIVKLSHASAPPRHTIVHAVAAEQSMFPFASQAFCPMQRTRHGMPAGHFTGNLQAVLGQSISHTPPSQLLHTVGHTGATSAPVSMAPVSEPVSWGAPSERFGTSTALWSSSERSSMPMSTPHATAVTLSTQPVTVVLARILTGST